MKKTSKLGIKSQPTVEPNGQEIYPHLIEGVQLKPGNTHIDDRGGLMELFSLSWNIVPEPIVHVYNVTIRPNKIKGWSIHQEQTDRMFIYKGVLKIVLYDFRKDSPTYKKFNEFYFGEEKPMFIVIPKMVYHAVHNVGTSEAAFVSFPTKMYKYDNPDRHRLPPTTEEIPYDFFKMNIGK